MVENKPCGKPGRDAEVNMDVKKRREERIRELYRDPHRAGSPRAEAEYKPEQAWKEWRTPPTHNQLYKKLAVCAVVYALVWGIFHVQHPVADRAEAAVRGMLTDSFNFAKAGEWYTRYIGELPTFLPAFDRKDAAESEDRYTVPAVGSVVSPYTVTNQGIWLSTKLNQSVTVISTGLVESVSESPVTGLTVVVRHTDGVESIYGWLESVSVDKNDWLKGGAEIGKVKEDAEDGVGKLYFAVKQNKAFIDPGDVIPFD